MRVKFIIILLFSILANSAFASYDGKKMLKVDFYSSGSATITIEKDLEYVFDETDKINKTRYRKVNENDWKLSYEKQFTINEPGLYELYVNSYDNGWGEVVEWQQNVYIPFPHPGIAEELAKQYMPVTVFHKDEEYFPQSLEKILSFEEGTESIQIAGIEKNGNSLGMGEDLMGFMEFNGHSDAYFDFQFEETTCKRKTDGSCVISVPVGLIPPVFVDVEYDELFLRASNKIANGFDISDSEIYWDASEENGILYLTYYYFYSFDPKTGSSSNPNIGAHAFDRESFTIRLVKNEYGEYQPIDVTYAGHLPYQTIMFKGCADNNHSVCDSDKRTGLLDWKGGKTTIGWDYINKVGKHPVIYKARGAHAIYPTYGFYEVQVTKEGFGVRLLKEPAGSVSDSQIILPDESRLNKLDYSDLGFLSFSGAWVDVLSGNDAKFPPFIRTPYSTWLSETNDVFNDCLNGTEKNDECDEVKNFFDNIRGMNDYHAITVSVIDFQTGAAIPNAKVKLRALDDPEDVNGTTLSDGIYSFFFVPKQNVNYQLYTVTPDFDEIECGESFTVNPDDPIPNNKPAITCKMTVVDAKLDACITKAGFTYADEITKLDCNDQSISDLTGISALTNLTELDLGNNQIIDVSRLATLTNLTDLDLGNNQIIDVSRLATLTNLTDLNLSGNQIVDVSSLNNLTKLEMLWLNNNQIIDVSSLATLTELKGLWLEWNKIVDVNSLNNLTKLENLDLGDNQIVDVSSLATMTKLWYLGLGNNEIVDVSSLATLVKLEKLDLSYNPDIPDADIVALQGLLPDCEIIRDEGEDICDSSHLSLCTIETDCTSADGHWYDDICNIEEEAATVTSVTPTTAEPNTLTQFTIIGTNFTETVTAQIQGADCPQEHKQRISATEFRLKCQHNAEETLSLTVVTASGGELLEGGAVDIQFAAPQYDICNYQQTKEGLARAAFKISDSVQTIDNPGLVTCDYLAAECGGVEYKDMGLGLDVHSGIDYRSKNGAEAGLHNVYALVAGTVVRAENQSASGIIAIRYTDNGQTNMLGYAHLDSVNVAEGDSVKVGDFIGKTGKRSAYGAVAPHLHIELRENYSNVSLLAGISCGADENCSEQEVAAATASPLSILSYSQNQAHCSVEVTTSKLNDTGITRCANGSDNDLDCAQAGFPNQDAEYGRDVTHNDDSDGHAGFSFTKLDASGDPLPASATEWSCVKDNVTGLIWEVKTDDGGLRDKDNTYTWYNSDSNTNGGNAGTENGGTCPDEGNCDTAKYVASVNATGLCGFNDWRMPAREELHSIVNYGRYDPVIDTAYFPHTRSSWYWTASFYTGNGDLDAWLFDFLRGGATNTSKSSDRYSLLVRDQKNDDGKVDLPKMMNIQVNPTSGNAGDIFSFSCSLSGDLPNGYELYANFGSDPEGFLEQGDDGGHVKMSDNCTLTQPINGAGNRKFQIGIFDSNGNRVGEYSSSKSFTVYETGNPDLTVSITTSTSTYTVGDTLRIDATVRNVGDGVAEPTTLYFRACTTGVISMQSNKCKTFSEKPTISELEPSESVSKSISPSVNGASDGVWIGACVEEVSGESNTNNNCSSGKKLSFVEAGQPDLTISIETDKSTYTVGDTFTVDATITNIGSLTADGSTVKYYLSTNSTIDTGDNEFGTDSFSAITAGSSANESIGKKVTGAIDTVYVGACVIAVSGESNTNNNCSSGKKLSFVEAGQPDLTISIETDKSTYTVGDTFTVDATITNIGSLTADGSTVKYYLSTNSTIDTGDTEFGTDSFSAITASSSANESIGKEVTGAIDVVYVGACVVAVSGESNTSNNCSAGKGLSFTENENDKIVAEGVGNDRDALISPNGGESWLNGQQQTISWMPQYITGDTVDLYVLHDVPIGLLDKYDNEIGTAINARNWYKFASGINNTGIYVVDPDDLNGNGNAYMILVVSSDNNREFDLSDGLFSLNDE